MSMRAPEPGAVRTFLKDGILEGHRVDYNSGDWMPPEFELESIEEREPSAWDKRHGAIATVVWNLAGPDSTDAIVFTIFPSVTAAKRAWDGGTPHLPPAFEVER
jgi:hypothetical protein